MKANAFFNKGEYGNAIKHYKGAYDMNLETEPRARVVMLTKMA